MIQLIKANTVVLVHYGRCGLGLSGWPLDAHHLQMILCQCSTVCDAQKSEHSYFLIKIQKCTLLMYSNLVFATNPCCDRHLMLIIGIICSFVHI